MNRFVTPFLISLLLLLTACARKEFQLEFELPENIDAHYTAIYYASDKRGGMNVETVAVVSHGKGKLRCQTINPTILYLYTSAEYPLVIYAERGDKIKISGTKPDPASWTVDGNETNVLLSEWRNANVRDLASNDPVKINAAVEKYVAAHPASDISPLLLLTSFARYDDDDDARFRSLWRKLSGEARSPKWAMLIGRADIPSGAAKEPALVRQMALRTAGHGLDTLRIGKAKASLFFFWNNGMKNRRETFDSIRALARQFPDSAKRLIVDVCLDPDSISWKSPMKSDSLSKTVRAWVPAGIADRTLMKVGVNYTPFYMVVSPDGKQRYRGDSQDDAFKEFRKLMGK